MRIRDKLAIQEERDAGRGRQPESALTPPKQDPREYILWESVGDKLFAVELDELSCGHHPQVTCLIMVDRVDRIVWQAVGGRISGELAALKARQSFLSRHPEYAEIGRASCRERVQV